MVVIVIVIYDSLISHCLVDHIHFIIVASFSDAYAMLALPMLVGYHQTDSGSIWSCPAKTSPEALPCLREYLHLLENRVFIACLCFNASMIYITHRRNKVQCRHLWSFDIILPCIVMVDNDHLMSKN